MSDTWGLFPADVVSRLRVIEWDNRANLRARIAGQRPFPIVQTLRPPNGTQALADLARFRQFVSDWRNHPLQRLVTFEARGMRGLDRQDVPTYITLRGVDDLAGLLGLEQQLATFARRLDVVDKALPGSRGEALRRLDELADLSPEAFDDLVNVLPQLREGMGAGSYVRALPLDGVGTKVVEQYEPLLQALFAAAYQDPGLDLYRWLNVRRPDTGTVLVRILDPALAPLFAGLRTLWISAKDVYALEVPSARILIVENAQSVLGLPDSEGVIALGATGRDLSWTSVPWLVGRECCYWGDLDSWGFHLLEQARTRLPHIASMLMDPETLTANRSRCSTETSSYVGPLGASLTQREMNALKALRASPDANRLEQEKIPASDVAASLRSWCSSNAGQ